MNFHEFVEGENRGVQYLIHITTTLRLESTHRLRQSSQQKGKRPS